MPKKDLLSQIFVKPQKKKSKPKRYIPYGKYLYFIFLVVSISAFFMLPVSANNIWTRAGEIMQDVYTQILAISTIAGIVTASIALLLMNFSKNGRTVDESRAWLKRIIISWAILNSLGLIMAYIVPFFTDGRWNP